MKLHKEEIKYRQHLANQRRVKEIDEELKNRPLIRLDKPITKGWKVTIDIREDIRKRDDAEYIKEAVTIGYSYGLTRDIKHVKMIRKGETGYSHTTYKGKKTWISFFPERIHLSEKKYEQLILQIKKYFYLDTISPAYLKYGRKYYIVVLHDYWLVLKCKPIIHTHYVAKGGKLDKERSYLLDEIHRYWQLKTGGYSTSYPAYKDRARLRDKVAKFKKGEIEDIENEKIPKEYDY